MKTWEMVKALTEDPKLKFKSKDGFIASVHDAILRLEYRERYSCINGNIRLLDCNGYNADEWELVPQFIPFDEAIKAAIDGKKPTIDLGGARYTLSAEKSVLSKIGYWLSVTYEDDTVELSTGMIDSMWTVEE
jgi:hypothetical protein